MVYVKNLPAWERVARLLGACTMVAYGLNFDGTPLGWTLLALGAVAAATAVLGFRPAYAVAGRRWLGGRAQP